MQINFPSVIQGSYQSVCLTKRELNLIKKITHFFVVCYQNAHKNFFSIFLSLSQKLLKFILETLNSYWENFCALIIDIDFLWKKWVRKEYAGYFLLGREEISNNSELMFLVWAFWFEAKFWVFGWDSDWVLCFWLFCILAFLEWSTYTIYINLKFFISQLLKMPKNNTNRRVEFFSNTSIIFSH